MTAGSAFYNKSSPLNLFQSVFCSLQARLHFFSCHHLSFFGLYSNWMNLDQLIDWADHFFFFRYFWNFLIILLFSRVFSFECCPILLVHQQNMEPPFVLFILACFFGDVQLVTVLVIFCGSIRDLNASRRFYFYFLTFG